MKEKTEWGQNGRAADRSLDIIVPCLNEELCIHLFYQRVCEVLQDVDICYYFIFVDDGSSDGTLREIKKLSGFSREQVGYLSFSRNFGKEAAIYAGLEASSSDYVAVMDCDLQDPPELLPRMLEAIEEGYDCCGAKREDRKGEALFRSFFSHRFYKLVNRISDVKLEENVRDYRMMKRAVVEALLLLSERDRFSKGLFSWIGFRTKWLSYENKKRAAGSTKWSFWQLFCYAVSGMVSFSAVPLKIAVAVGTVLVAGDFLYAFYLLVMNLLFDTKVPGYASLMIMMIFLGGVIILFLGVIGEYLARIYMEIKERPIYIAREKRIPKRETAYEDKDPAEEQEKRWKAGQEECAGTRELCEGMPDGCK